MNRFRLAILACAAFSLNGQPQYCVDLHFASGAQVGSTCVDVHQLAPQILPPLDFSKMGWVMTLTSAGYALAPAGIGSGTVGPMGPQGPQGAPGKDGAIGAQGLVGLPGPAGPAGSVGRDGAPGPQGIPGKDFALSVAPRVGDTVKWDGVRWIPVPMSAPGTGGPTAPSVDLGPAVMDLTNRLAAAEQTIASLKGIPQKAHITAGTGIVVPGFDGDQTVALDQVLFVGKCKVSAFPGDPNGNVIGSPCDLVLNEFGALYVKQAGQFTNIGWMMK